MNALSAQTMRDTGQPKGRTPALGNVLLSEGYNEGTRGDITVKMISRLNKLLGTYSKEHEERIAKDILDVINHIKGSEDNARMKHPSCNRLGRDTAKVFQTIYMSSKNIALEFSHLMSENIPEVGAEADYGKQNVSIEIQINHLMKEGVVKAETEAAHNEEKISELRKNASYIIWALELELRVIRGIVRHESNDCFINEKLVEVVDGFASLMETDMKVFCDVHGIKNGYETSSPPPSTTSSE